MWLGLTLVKCDFEEDNSVLPFDDQQLKWSPKYVCGDSFGNLLKLSTILRKNKTRQKKNHACPNLRLNDNIDHKSAASFFFFFNFCVFWQRGPESQEFHYCYILLKLPYNFIWSASNSRWALVSAVLWGGWPSCDEARQVSVAEKKKKSIV